METIGTKIKREMKEKGVSQTALSNALGMSQQQVSYNLGRDESDISVGFVKEACRVLGVPASSILLDDSEREEVGSINSDIVPIVQELNYAVDHYSKTEQRQVFVMIMSALKGLRIARDGE